MWLFGVVCGLFLLALNVFFFSGLRSTLVVVDLGKLRHEQMCYATREATKEKRFSHSFLLLLCPSVNSSSAISVASKFFLLKGNLRRQDLKRKKTRMDSRTGQNRKKHTTL